MTTTKYSQRVGLAWRLVALGTAAGLLVSTIGGWFLRQNVQTTLLKHYEQRLEEKALRIESSFFGVDEGKRIRWQGRSNDEFARIFSGWYWQLDGEPEILASRSLWDSRLDIALATPVSGYPGLLEVRGPQAVSLIGISREITFDGMSFRLYVFGPAYDITDEMARLDRILLITQLGLIAALLLTSIFQVRFGLIPLHRLHKRLIDVRTGKFERIGSGYGPELSPLAEELDLLLTRNTRIVDRARSHAADLSHALKKPLTLLAADGELKRHPLLREQVTAMAQLIDRHLARAGSGAGSARQVSVGTCINNLVDLMQHLHHDKKLDWQVECSDNLLWRGEQTDFEEMLGNLLDNAGKWAATRVTMTAYRQGDEIVVDIADDGPGLSPEQILVTGIRGCRFDQDVEGSGLGLAITGDIAETYGGKLVLDRALSGGLHANLRLPG